MEISYQIIIIIFIHWVADFLFQTSKMALNKSKDNRWLLLHVFTYTIVFAVIGLNILDSDQYLGLLMFCGVTFIAHFIQDYITSRWTSSLYAEKKFYGVFPTFFKVIGLDQFLHYVQLILCYKFFILN